MTLDLKQTLGVDFLFDRTIKVSDGIVKTKKNGAIRFDYAVIATGSSTDFFANDSFVKFGYP